MKCVLVTGAAGGIGQALVGTFSAAGYAVIGTDVAAPPPELALDHFVSCDLRRMVEDQSYAAECFGCVGKLLDGRPLAALINNAAVQLIGPMERLDRDAWRTTLDVNLLAPFLWAQAMLPDLESAGGCIINVSSIHARLTKAGFLAYATSKAALSGLTRAMAVELGGRVRVNAIEPAAVRTAMLEAGFEGRPDLYRRLEACHPQGRIGEPPEVANLALAIVGGGMDFLNGACVGIDGGIGARLFDP